MTDFFKGIPAIRYEGPESSNEFAFRHYNPDEVVMGKRMEDHLRFAVAYWHSFAWPGGDPFGGQTFERPWFGDTIVALFTDEPAPLGRNPRPGAIAWTPGLETHLAAAAGAGAAWLAAGACAVPVCGVSPSGGPSVSPYVRTSRNSATAAASITA